MVLGSAARIQLYDSVISDSSSHDSVLVVSLILDSEALLLILKAI